MKKFITIALVPIIALAFGTFVFAGEPVVEKKAEPARPTSKARLIDINTASETELKAVLGLEDEEAKKIIAARPYTSKDQLKTKNVISADSYEKIKRLIDAVC